MLNMSASTSVLPSVLPGFYTNQVVDEIKDYAIFTMDTEGYFTSWNQGAKKIFGFTPDEIDGKHFRFIFPRKLREQNLPEHELEVAARDGKYEAEEWHRRKGGGKFWALNVLTAVHDQAGKVVSYTKIVKDLTERKQIEDSLYEQSEQIARVKHDLNQFIYSASHELRAPACNIEGLLNVLDVNRPKEEIAQIANYLRDSLSVLKGKVDEVCQMANFTHRLEDQQPEEIDLEKLFQDVMYLIRDEVKATNASVTSTFIASTFSFVRTQLQLIFQQLMLNAISFGDAHRGTEVAVKVSPHQQGIRLEVSDNGSGIPQDQLYNIFALFTKIRPTSPGRGLGLYYVKRIVDQARGSITVESQLGAGSTFSIYLPPFTNAE